MSLFINIMTNESNKICEETNLQKIGNLIKIPYYDLIEETNSLYYGRPGGLGHRYANLIQQNSDLFLSIGARLNLLQTGYNFDGFARAAYKIQVDIDSNELRKINVRPDMPVCSDAGLFIKKILKNKQLIILARLQEQ